MSDEKVRALEASWRASGSVEDEAAFLLERVRVGELTEGKLELAAYCGHEAAGEVLGDKAPEVPRSLQQWLNVLTQFSFAVALRAVVGVARYFAEEENWEVEGRNPAAPQALDAAEAWIHCPCADHANACSIASKFPPRRFEWPALIAVQMAAQEGWPDLSETPGFPLPVFMALTSTGWGIKPILHDELVPWVLGYRDPVCERVEARQRAEAAGG